MHVPSAHPFPPKEADLISSTCNATSIALHFALEGADSLSWGAVSHFPMRSRSLLQATFDLEDIFCVRGTSCPLLRCYGSRGLGSPPQDVSWGPDSLLRRCLLSRRIWSLLMTLFVLEVLILSSEVSWGLDFLLKTPNAPRGPVFLLKALFHHISYFPPWGGCRPDSLHCIYLKYFRAPI